MFFKLALVFFVAVVAVVNCQRYQYMSAQSGRPNVQVHQGDGAVQVLDGVQGLPPLGGISVNNGRVYREAAQGSAPSRPSQAVVVDGVDYTGRNVNRPGLQISQGSGPDQY